MPPLTAAHLDRVGTAATFARDFVPSQQVPPGPLHSTSLAAAVGPLPTVLPAHDMHGFLTRQRESYLPDGPHPTLGSGVVHAHLWGLRAECPVACDSQQDPASADLPGRGRLQTPSTTGASASLRLAVWKDVAMTEESQQGAPKLCGAGYSNSSAA